MPAMSFAPVIAILCVTFIVAMLEMIAKVMLHRNLEKTAMGKYDRI